MAWNGSDGAVAPRKIEKKAKPSIWRGLLAAIIVIGGAVGAFIYLLTPVAKSGTDNNTARPGMIAEATPELANETIAEEEPEPLQPKEVPYWERETPDGLTFRQTMKWKIHHRPPAAYTNDTSQTELKPAYAIFETRSDNHIAALLTVPPGTTAVGDPEYELWFTRDFLKSLETPIIVTDEDTPEEAQLKRDMITTKLDLKARYDAGEDLAQIMKSSREELQRLATYKTELESAFRDMASKPGLTEQDIDDFLESANILLDSKGIAPMTLGPLAKMRLMRKANGY